ncbi:Conserved_hypothetical protein [Hexamita inflata]|uniref:Uncharacterized protein n=1 Tax=Hexamita inflata TaxID=28002 RepID=A0AA86NSX0_9EUKA|nr:Conserved hypothetical protein [Hexamita inflata]
MKVFIQFGDTPVVKSICDVLLSKNIQFVCNLLDYDKYDQFIKQNPRMESHTLPQLDSLSEVMLNHFTRADVIILQSIDVSFSFKMLEMLKTLQQQPDTKQARKLILLSQKSDKQTELLNNRCNNLIKRGLVSGCIIKHGLVYDAPNTQENAFGDLVNYMCAQKISLSVDLDYQIPITSSARVAVALYKLITSKQDLTELLIVDQYYHIQQLVEFINATFTHQRRTPSQVQTTQIQQQPKDKSKTPVSFQSAEIVQQPEFKKQIIDAPFMLFESPLQLILSSVLACSRKPVQQDMPDFSLKSFSSYLNFQQSTDTVMLEMQHILQKQQIQFVPTVFENLNQVMQMYVLHQLVYQDVHLQGNQYLNQFNFKVEFTKSLSYIQVSPVEIVKNLLQLGENAKNPEFWAGFVNQPDKMAMCVRFAYSKGFQAEAKGDEAAADFLEQFVKIEEIKTEGKKDAKKEEVKVVADKNNINSVVIQIITLLFRECQFKHQNCAFYGFETQTELDILHTLFHADLNETIALVGDQLNIYLDPKKQPNNVQKGQLPFASLAAQLQVQPGTSTTIGQMYVPQYSISSAVINPVVGEILRNGDKSKLVSRPEEFESYSIIAQDLKKLIKIIQLQTTEDRFVVNLKPSVYCRVPLIYDISALCIDKQQLLDVYRFTYNITRYPPGPDPKKPIVYPERPQFELLEQKQYSRQPMRIMLQMLKNQQQLTSFQTEQLIQVFGSKSTPVTQLLFIQEFQQPYSVDSFAKFLGKTPPQKHVTRAPSANGSKSPDFKKAPEQQIKKENPKDVKEKEKPLQEAIKDTTLIKNLPKNEKLETLKILQSMQQQFAQLLSDKYDFYSQKDKTEKEKEEREFVIGQLNKKIGSRDDFQTKPKSSKPEPKDQAKVLGDENVNETLFKEVEDVQKYFEEINLGPLLEQCLTNLILGVEAGLVDNQIEFLGEEILRWNK